MVKDCEDVRNYVSAAVENVLTNLLQLLHLGRPVGADIFGVIMGGKAEIGHRLIAIGGLFRDLHRQVPRLGFAASLSYAVTGEGELAGVSPVLVLIDDATDAIGIAVIGNAVENNLRHRHLAIPALAAGLMIYCCGETLYLAGTRPGLDIGC